MSSPSRPTAPKSSSGSPRRGGKSTSQRLNRSQQRAMEIRAAATRYADSAVDAADTASPDYGTTGRMIAAPQVRRTASARGRVAARPVLLSQQQEYRFIRADLRHLLVTASALFLIMIILLWVIE